MIKITVIISIYKDIEALNLILQSLNTQTISDFDIVVSQDCQSQEITDYISSYSLPIKLTHIDQPDKGWQKNIALNNAIKKSSGEYLIFLDGDVIPYKSFIENHINSAEKKRFLSGRRVELGSFFSKMIRKQKFSVRVIEKLYLFLIPFLALDKARHIEEGISLKKDTYLEKKINSNKNKNMVPIGCNFSCFKEDLLTINGFDEDYLSPSIGEDGDLVWRFNHFGITYKSVRYIANVFHLYHTRNWGNANKENRNMMKEKIIKKEYICHNGLNKLYKPFYKR